MLFLLKNRNVKLMFFKSKIVTMERPLFVKITSDHLLCIFLCLLWGVTDSNTNSNATNETKTLTTSISSSENVKKVTVLRQNESSITLKWDKVNNISTYMLQYDGNVRDMINASCQVKSVEHIVSSLNAGKKYNFTLITVLEGINSTGFVFKARTAPPNAEKFTSVGQSETSITLQWAKVNGILNYTLKFNNTETNVTGNNQNDNVTYIASDLKSGTQYNFTLFTVLENVRSTGVNLSALTVPRNAEEFKSVGQNETSITLQWKKGHGTNNYILKFNNTETNVTGKEENDNVTYIASDLKSGTQYNFTLFTVFKNVRSTGEQLTAVTAPSNAENFTSVGQNETSIILQWEKVNGILNYTLKFNNTETNVTEKEENDNVTYIASDLKSGTQYNFTLFTVFENVRSTGVNLSALTVPRNAEEFKSVGQNETSITLQWKKGHGTNNYILKFNNTETNVTGKEENDNVTYIASDLKSGTQYDFTLFTVFKNVRSTGEQLTAVTAPSNAENFTSVGQNETSITLQWAKVNGILNYTLKFNNTETNVTGKEENDNLTYIASDLKSGTQYNFTLFTVFKNVRSTGEQLTAVTAPSNAENFTSVGQNETSIILQWEKVNGILNYTLKFNNTETNVTGKEENDNLTYIASDLKSGTQYNFTLFTVFENVRSTGVNLSALTVPRNAEEFKSVGQNETSITLQWKKGHGTNNYILKFNNTETNVTGKEGNDKVTYIASDLKSRTQYNFTLFTVFKNVRSTGEQLTAVTAPSNAKHFRSAGQNETSITLQWEKVNGILNYTLKFNNTETNVTGKEGNDNVTYIASDLKSGTQYDFTLFTVFENVRSTGAQLTAVTAPSNAKHFRSAGQNETSITLQWAKVNGILNYTLKFNNIETNVTGKEGNDNVTYIASDLKSGTQYNFTLFTVFENVRSTGEQLTAVTAPSNAKHFRSARQNETSITLQWEKVNGILNYTLKFNNIETNVTGKEGNDNVTYIASDLKSGTQYDFTLFTVFENVRSTGAQLTAVTVPRDTEVFRSVGQNETSISLQWKKVDGMLNYILHFSKTETNVTGKKEDENVIYVAPGLNSATKYSFTLFTVVGNVRSSGVNLTAVTAPSNPDEFKSIGQNETSITLQWKKVKDILKYTLAFDETKINVSAVGDNVTHTILKLNSGTKYNFTLFTEFENLSSRGLTLTAVTAPGNVRKVTVLGQNESSIILTWEKVNNISTYILQFFNNANAVTGKSSASDQESSVTHAVTLLTAGTKYNFILITVFEGVNSTGHKFNAATVPPMVPWVNVTERSVTKITLMWNANNNWSYLLQINGTDVMKNLSSPNVTHSLTSLKPGTAYNFSVITMFDGLNSTAYKDYTVTAIDCANVTWHVTNSSIQGTVEGLFSEANASSALRTHVSQGGSNVSFTGLCPGETYVISLVYEKYQQCRHNLTILPPDLMGRCEYWESGYSIYVVWKKPNGVWTAVEINVGGQTYVAKYGEQHQVISGFQPAKNYEVSLTSLSGAVRSSTTFVFTCPTDPRAVIAGSVLAVLFFLLICLAVFILFMRPDLIRKKAFICGSIISFGKCKAIPVAQFEDHFFHLSMDENRGFSLEYESLAPVGTEQTQKAAVLPENKAKNRFNNVLPYDWSRVRLSTHPGGTSDYINANYMPGYNRNREYIATQGPLPSTVNDFWRMIWEQRVTGIVMVTNCTEGGRTKCEQYWPAYRHSCHYGQLEVIMRFEQQEPNWTLREFTVTHRNTLESRTVRHFHFTAWPDHGVPQSTEVLIQFRGVVRQHIEKDGTGAPTVVHCSAGVGRTGTIIALDVFLQQLEEKGAVGINAFVHKMRLSRPHMVQTESQYIFLHQCIIDSLHPCEKTEENIYENTEGIYVNATALREFHKNSNT